MRASRNDYVPWCRHTYSEFTLAVAPAALDPSVGIMAGSPPHLGLKLEPSRGSIEVLMIDRVEKPAQNWLFETQRRRRIDAARAVRRNHARRGRNQGQQHNHPDNGLRVMWLNAVKLRRN